MDPLFRFEGVTKVFGSAAGRTTALDDVSLDVPDGSFFGLVGTSGAGKSTLLRMLNLLERPTAGRVLFRDRDLATLRGSARRDYLSTAATVFQHFNLFHGKTVLDNVAFPLAVRGVGRRARRRRAADLVEVVGLTGKENAYPSQLSGGQKQRVGIARALACDPEVLLCDEATSALDSETTMVILDLLRDLHRQQGFTVVLITHSWEVVRRACDWVTLLADGRVVESGQVLDLVGQPASVVGGLLVPAAVSLDDRLVLDLAFDDPAHQTAALSCLARELAVDCSVVSGRVQQVADTTVARFQVALTPARPGRHTDVATVLGFLADRGVRVSGFRAAAGTQVVGAARG